MYINNHLLLIKIYYVQIMVYLSFINNVWVRVWKLLWQFNFLFNYLHVIYIILNKQ
jgi:hypothetical protein